MNEKIHVCSLSTVDKTLALSGATHLVSLINSVAMISTPDLIDPANHLRLTMNDISAPKDNLLPPEPNHIEELLAFITSWDQKTPMLIHCLAGMSRSTAAAFITLCHLNPETDEQHIARVLRRTSPTAHPNRLIVNHGDKLLGRDGRMIYAIDQLGPGAIADEGSPFSLPSTISNS